MKKVNDCGHDRFTMGSWFTSKEEGTYEHLLSA